MVTNLELTLSFAAFLTAAALGWLLSYARAAAALERLRAAVRRHRDFRGDDRCWLDDEALYSNLPEGYTPPSRDSAVELENCRRFVFCRYNPATEYVSPQREVERLQEVVKSLAARCHVQAEVLASRACKPEVTPVPPDATPSPAATAEAAT